MAVLLSGFNALLGSLSRALQWERSLKLLVDMGGDDITYQTSLAACSRLAALSVLRPYHHACMPLPTMGSDWCGRFMHVADSSPLDLKRG